MYAKLFSSMYDGTLGTRGPWQALITFQQLLVLADRFGVIDMTPEVISRRTLIPIEIIQIGLENLQKPDPLSRRNEEEGRRIVLLDPARVWGWRIVNYAHYHAIRNAEERRDYQRGYMREYRKAARRQKRQTPTDTGEVLECVPIIGGEDWPARQSFCDELARLYPSVDVPQTLREIRGWCIGNPTKLKTARGVRRFVTSWIAREQDKHG